MAEEGTLCTNSNVTYLAGVNASATSKAEAYTNVYIKMAEGFICTSAQYDFVTNYASLSTIGKEILRQATASLAAIYVITYDLGGESLTEEQTRLQTLWDTVRECINLLRENDYSQFVQDGDLE
jgi:hypothetical protein